MADAALPPAPTIDIRQRVQAHASRLRRVKLIDILLRGQSSRLYQRLGDKEQVANSVSGGQSPRIDPSLFQFSIQPRSGVDTTRVEQILYEELEKVSREL